MIRFRSALIAIAFVGCAAPAPSRPALVRLREMPPNAFGVGRDAFDDAPRLWQQKIDAVDLLGDDPQDFPGVRLLPDGSGAEIRDADPLRIVGDILRDFVAPGSWDRKSLLIEDGTLTVRRPPGVILAVQSALKTLRENKGRLIRSRVTMTGLRADALAKLENIPAVEGGLVGTFDRSELEKVLGREKAAPTLAAPVVTAFHGQKSHVMILTQKAYVAGFETGVNSADPQVGITTEGVVTELRAIANGDRAGEFLLSFQVQLASPSEVVNIPLGSGVVQLPAQGYARISGRCTLGADHALLLVTRNPNLREADHPILALVITVDWGE